jgi:hypothetical protein
VAEQPSPPTVLPSSHSSTGGFSEAIAARGVERDRRDAGVAGTSVTTIVPEAGEPLVPTENGTMPAPGTNGATLRVRFARARAELDEEHARVVVDLIVAVQVLARIEEVIVVDVLARPVVLALAGALRGRARAARDRAERRFASPTGLMNWKSAPPG